jgi:hypothetical protein
MQRFEWTEQGLVAKLSENIIPFHPPKMSETIAPPIEAAHHLTNGANGANGAVVSDKVVKEDHSNVSIWKTVHTLAADLRTKVGRALTYLCLQISKTLLDFNTDGGVIVNGSKIPGTNIVDILVSALTAPNEFEIGEMLILSLLQHCPRSILKTIQKPKLSFIKDDEKEEEFEPLMQQAVKKRGMTQPAVKTKHTKFDPQFTASYVPKKAALSTLPDVLDSHIPKKNMSERKWFDLS